MQVSQFDKPEHFSAPSLTSYLENNENPLTDYGYLGVLENFTKSGPTSYSRDATESYLVCLTDVAVPAQALTDFQAMLNNGVKRHHLLMVAQAKVDRKTKALFAQGFRYSDGVVHSMSQNAQRTFLGMYVSRDLMEAAGMFREPFPVASLDNFSHTILKNKGDLVAFYSGIVAAVAAYKHGGTMVKLSLNDLSDEALEAFEDPRPLEPIQV